MELHPLAAAGFADVADVYERGRPEYAPGVLELLAREIGVGRGRIVLDLGAGTGKLTRPLLAAGASVVAVEPQPAMRVRLPAAATVLDAAAEALTLGDASVDAAVAGDSWHWFDSERAAAELARVLRPGGGVALLWQRASENSDRPWMAELGALLFELRGDHPGLGGAGREPLDGRSPFAALVQHSVPFVHETDRAGVLAWVGSMSFVASLPDERRAQVLARVAPLVPDGPVDIEHETQVWVTHLRG